MAEEKKDIRLPPLVPSVKSPRTEVYPTPRSDISHAMSLPPVLSSVKSNDPRRPIFHSHVVYGSPLWHRDTVQTTIRPLPSPTTLRSLEGAFVNDAVKTAIFTRPRKIPIIPDYVAAEDKYARAYFKSPMVQNTMAKGSQEYVVGSPRRTMNKLSVRHRCRSTPPAEDLSNREKEFVNDAIITEKKRTKYKDIIPPYDAVKDKNARAYFMRRDIQQLIGVTRSAR